MTKSNWKEIKCNFVDEEEAFIKAWKTSKDNEKGKVIAKINLLTQEVEYLDEKAKTDPYAQEIINKVILIEEIKKKINYEKRIMKECAFGKIDLLYLSSLAKELDVLINQIV